MDTRDALEIVRGAARLRRYDVVRHAGEQADSRSVQAHDLRNAMMTATDAEWDEAKGTWRLTGGQDSEGQPLKVVVAIDGYDVRVVTVF